MITDKKKANPAEMVTTRVISRSLQELLAKITKIMIAANNPDNNKNSRLELGTKGCSTKNIQTEIK